VRPLCVPVRLYVPVRPRLSGRRRLPVRLAAVMVAVTAAATGCVSVGDGDAHRAGPSRSAGQPGGEVPDGMSAESGGGGGGGYGVGAGGDGKHAHAGKAKHGDSSPSSSPPSREVDGVAVSAPVKPGGSTRPTPTVPAPPVPTRTSGPTGTATPTETTPPPSSPPSAVPSSSAHEGTGPQLADREVAPAPAAGTPAFGNVAMGPPVASSVPLAY
jgi:hypothetical protein